MAGSRARRRGGFALAAATLGLVAFAGLRARSSGATAQLATILGSEGALFVPSAFSPSSNASVNGIPLYDDEAPLGAYRPNLYKKTHSSLRQRAEALDADADVVELSTAGRVRRLAEDVAVGDAQRYGCVRVEVAGRRHDREFTLDGVDVAAR
jgi:hypothetical protein